MLSELLKHEIIIKYKLGQTMNQIANDMKINIRTVVLWLKRFCETKSVSRKSRKGTNKLTTNEEDEKILKLALKNDKFRLLSLQKELIEQKIYISKTTIWRRLKENNYIYGNYLNKPALTEKQIIKRLEWCNKYKNTDWTKIMFSDEATIYMNKNNTKCWFISGSRKINRKKRHSIKLNLWAFITVEGLGQYELFKENLNADKYESILFENLFSVYDETYKFQQDNHPVHKSNQLKNFFNDYNIETIDWPPNSPDLNPIENLWALVKYELSLLELTKENFEQTIKNTLDKINLIHIYNMIGNMHVRLQQVIDSNGDSINY